MGKTFTAGLHSSLDGNRLTKFFPPALLLLDNLNSAKLSAQVKYLMCMVLCPDLGLCSSTIIYVLLM